MPASNDVLLDVLTRFARTLVSHYDLADVLYELSDRVVEVLGATAAGVTLADEKGRLGFITATTDAAAQLELVQQDEQEGPCHRAYATGTAVLIPDLSVHTEWPRYRETAARVGLSSVVGIPMSLHTKQLGALNIYDASPRSWSAEEATTAQVLADIATAFVAHASELDQARRVNEQLQHALDSRILIEQAKGLLAGERNISLDQAYAALRRHARNKQVTLRSIAEAVVKLGLRPE